MRKCILSGLVIVLSGQPALAQIEIQDRKVQYIEKTKSSRVDEFSRARVWLAKNFIRTKDSVQLDDRDAGHLIARGSVSSCRAFGSKDYLLTFLIDIEAKDKKIKIDFEQLWFFRSDSKNPGAGNAVYYAPVYPREVSDMKELKTECIDTVEADLLKAINSKPVEW